MSDQAVKSSPVISPDEVALLVKDGIPLMDIMSKLTPAEKSAFRKSPHFNDTSIVEPLGQGIFPIGNAGRIAAQAAQKVAPKMAGPMKAGLGRVSREGGGIVKGSGQPATITSKAAGHADDVPKNLEIQKNATKPFTETEKRANMFGGASVEGQVIKPNARVPMSLKEEAEKLAQEITKGKTGGSLPNNAPRGARLKSPKK